MMTDRQLTLSSSSLLPLSSLPPSPSVPFLLFFPPSLSSPPFFLSLPLFFPSFSYPLLPLLPSPPPSPPSLSLTAVIMSVASLTKTRTQSTKTSRDYYTTGQSSSFAIYSVVLFKLSTNKSHDLSHGVEIFNCLKPLLY